MNINEILTTEQSKINFLKGLIFLSKIDGNTDENERLFFTNASLSLNLTQESLKELDKCWTIEKPIAPNFETNKEKIFFFIQAIQLCNIDSTYTIEEKNLIRSYANSLNFSLDFILKIEDWVERGLKWQKEGNDFLNMEVM